MEIRVFKTLRRKPLNYTEIATNLNIAPDAVRSFINYMIRRHLVVERDGLVELGRGYRYVLQRRDERERRERAVERRKAKVESGRKQ